MEVYDLIIVGAGPAGLSLARELADSNLKILLIDKKRNAHDILYNSSGSFIDPKEYELPSYLVKPIGKLRFHSKNETLEVEAKGYIINRVELLKFLEKQAKKNKKLKTCYESTIEKIIIRNNRIEEIRYVQGNNIFNASAKIFADCSGNWGILKNKLGAKSQVFNTSLGIEYIVPVKKDVDAADFFLGKQFEGGYGWIFPQDPRTVLVGYGTFCKKNFPGIEDKIRGMWNIDIVSERCDLPFIERRVALLKTGKPSRRLVKENCVFIGDAALQANPLLGEGVRFSMEASRIASKWIKKALAARCLKLLDNYSSEWNKKNRAKYKLAWFLQRILNRISKNDVKIDKLLRSLKPFPTDFKEIIKGNLHYNKLLKLLAKHLLKV